MTACSHIIVSHSGGSINCEGSFSGEEYVHLMSCHSGDQKCGKTLRKSTRQISDAGSRAEGAAKIPKIGIIKISFI